MPRKAAPKSSILPGAPGPGAGARSAFEAAADELQVLARMLAFGSESPLWDDSQEQMLHLIHEALRDENDVLLARALEQTSHDGPALEQLLRHIEDVAGNPVVSFRGQMADAQVIVIPVLVTQHPSRGGGSFAYSADFEALASSIRGAGLVSTDATVVLLNYLYHPRELARLLPSQVSRVAQDVLDAQSGGPSSSPGARGQTGWPPQEDVPLGTSRATLCCLLAVVVGERAPWRVGEDLSQEANDQKLAAIEVWARTAVPPLAACLNLSRRSVHVLGFDSFFEGLRFGLKCFPDLCVHTELAAMLSEHSMEPNALSILLCCYGDIVQAREVRVSAVSRLDGALLLGKVLHVEGNEDAGDTIMRLTRCLRFCGIEDIGVLPEVQPLGQGGEVEEPIFLTLRDVERVSGVRNPPPPELDEGLIH